MKSVFTFNQSSSFTKANRFLLQIIKTNLIICTLLFSNGAYADDSKQALNKLNQLLQKTKSIQAQFTQTTTTDKTNQKTKQRSGMSGLKVTALNKEFSGSMMVQRPNQFRWHTKKPSEQLVVANKKILFIYDPDLEQATKQQIDKQFANTPALLLSGNATEIAKNFVVSQPKKNVETFLLVPKSLNATFESMALAFKNGIPKAMVLKDALGQVTTIKFNNVKLNKKLSANQFVFTPPAGVDIIEQ